MSSEDARKFREQYRQSEEKKLESKRYKAKKGSAYAAENKSRKNPKIDLKLVALLLAASIGVSAIGILGSPDKHYESDITSLKEKGIDINHIGLGQDTIQLMRKYDEYFTNFDEKKALGLTDNDVIAMLNDIKQLNYDALKDKIAALRGVSREDVKLHYRFEKGDGVDYTSVSINEDQYGKEENYSDANSFILGLGKKNCLPKEISDLILQLQNYDDIEGSLKADKITKIKAIKKLRKLYEKITEIATKEFIMDEKGNIYTVEYENKEMTNELDER